MSAHWRVNERNREVSPDETIASQEYAFDSLRFADFVGLSVQAADRVQVRKNPEVGVSVRSSVRC